MTLLRIGVASKELEMLACRSQVVYTGIFGEEQERREEPIYDRKQKREIRKARLERDGCIFTSLRYFWSCWI